MKKLFILSFMLCLLGGNRAWAGPFFYFVECPQLEYGTTSYNYLTPELLSSPAWTGNKTFSNWQSGKINITKDNFANAAIGDYIKVSASTVGENANFGLKHFPDNDYSDIVSGLYPEFNGNTSAQTELTSDLYNYIINNGLGIQGSNGSGFTMKSVEIVPSKSTFTWTAVPHDGITITGGYTSNSNGIYTLDTAHPDQFTFEGSGYIVIKCERNNYVASYLITVLEEGQKRHWDFTRHQFVMGPNSGYWRTANDNQWQPDQYSSDEPVIIYKGSINAPNSYYLAEINGGGEKILSINEDGANYYDLGKERLSIRNDGADFEDHHSLTRFVGIEPGVTVKIPNLKAGDRVRMKIDKYGTDMVLNFTNAKDALGKSITGNYQVGGSGDISNDKNVLDAYYNFFVESDGTFTFKQTSSQCILMKIYDIEVYTGDFKMSNEVLSRKVRLYDNNELPDENDPLRNKTVNAYSIVNGYQCIANFDHNPILGEKDLIKFDGGYYLHHRGKDETICDYQIMGTSHNLSLNYNDFELSYRESGGKIYKTDVLLKDATQTKISNNELFGSYILRVKLYDATQAYITDYADRIVSIGYIEKVNHPITWDFTDLKTYLDNDEYLRKETVYDYNTYGNKYYDKNNNSYDPHLDLSIWKKDENNDWRLDFNRKNPNGAPFAWGTQLYAGTKMFDETRGIGFAPVNNEVSTSSLKISDEGLRIEDPQSNGGWELTIHELDGLAAVYMRYEPIEGKTPIVRCEYNRTTYTDDGKPAAHVVYNKDITGTDEKVQAHSAFLLWDDEGGEAGRGCKNEFKIYLNNVVLKKIATSKDQKKISKPGYATESRLRDIDHSLTAYFTGLPIKAYAGYLPDDGDYSKVVLKEFDDDESHKVLPVSTAGIGQSNTGCILYHDVEIDATNGRNTSMGLDGGIHLFVPDMHDTEKTLNLNDLKNDGSNHKNVLLSFKPTHNYFSFDEQDKNNPENYIYSLENL